MGIIKFYTFAHFKRRPHGAMTHAVRPLGAPKGAHRRLSERASATHLMAAMVGRCLSKGRPSEKCKGLNKPRNPINK